jgi:hypothetical protein
MNQGTTHELTDLTDHIIQSDFDTAASQGGFAVFWGHS